MLTAEEKFHNRAINLKDLHHLINLY